jgi:hypothetical protein
MVIKSNSVQAGWHIDKDDSSIDNHSTGSTFGTNRNKNQPKNDQELFKGNFLNKTTHNIHTDEEGWTTTSPGRKKPKEKNSKGSTESIIKTIDGDIDMIDARAQNRIHVKSPGRAYRCNVPDKRRMEVEYQPKIMRANGGEMGKEQGKEGTQEGERTTSKQNETENNKNTNNEERGNEEKKGDEEENNKEESNKNSEEGNENNDRERNGRNEGDGRRGRGGRGGRNGRNGRIERKQIPRTEWETYEFSISFNPKTMKNKDPDEEFQAVLSQIMKKSPGVTFHPTNEDMHPKPSSFKTIQEYPQTEAAFKDFFEVYENKGLTTYKIFIKATMQYDELDLRNSLLNYLRSNNLWMSSEFISESIDEMIGYINYGHDKMVWRPEVEKKINNSIQAMIQSGSIPEALRLKIRGLKKQIHVRVAAGTFRGGTKNDPVMCEGLVLRTTKAQARASIELLGLLDEKVLGEFYSIIPRGIDKELGNQLYGELLRTNNDMLNTLRSITVVNWPEELFLDHYNPASDVEGTMAIRVDKILTEAWNCVAIERTTETEKRGKYLLIFQEADMEKAKASIGDLIEAFGRTSDRDSAKLALDKFQEYPEFDSIQRVSQSVQSKGLRIREMLEAAAAQRTASTPKKTTQPKFQFHVNKELQKQLQISTTKTYSTATKQTPQKKQLLIVQQPQHKLQPIIRQQTRTQVQTTVQMNEEGMMNQQNELNEQGMGVSREEWEEAQSQGQARTRMIQSAVTQESRTVATNNSGLSVDQQTITTMMTQITHQFKEMERDRITREERQERKRQERELKAEEKREEREIRIEEKRVDAQRDMYTFMQTMMTINQNNKQEKAIPDELTTGTTEQTSAITTSIATASSTNTPNGKRSSSLLSNTDEETEMKDKEKETEIEEYASDDETISIKRNKKITGKEEEEPEEDEEMIIENEQKITDINENETTTDETMTDQDGSFTTGFYSQQFKTKTRAKTSTSTWKGATQQ